MIKKITIKKIRMKNKIKNKLERKNNSLIKGLNWKKNNNRTKKSKK